MGRPTRVTLVLVSLAVAAGTASVGPPGRFLPTSKRPSLAAVTQRGKIAVSRTGDRLRVRVYLPAKRGGVDGVEVEAVVRPADRAR